MYVCVRVCVCVRACVCIDAYTHTRARAHTHTHIQHTHNEASTARGIAFKQLGYSSFFCGATSKEAPHEELPQHVNNSEAAQLHIACPQHHLRHNQKQN
jgi:hypothetical protein